MTQHLQLARKGGSRSCNIYKSSDSEHQINSINNKNHRGKIQCYYLKLHDGVGERGR